MGAPKPAGKKFAGKLRELGGKLVRICLYDGRASGHGRYYAGYTGSVASESLVLDVKGKPMQFRTIGQLVWPQFAAVKQ